MRKLSSISAWSAGFMKYGVDALSNTTVLTNMNVVPRLRIRNSSGIIKFYHMIVFRWNCTGSACI